MSDTLGAGPPPGRTLRQRWLDVLADRGFHRLAARVPGLRSIARREGAEMFDLVAGFVNSQVLSALLKLQVLDHLRDAPLQVADLARRCGAAPERLQVLCQAGAALGLLRQRGDGCWDLTRKGAVLPHVPGLRGMIEHHDILYRDLAQPEVFFARPTETELAAFWPYVFGAGAVNDQPTAQRFSDLMSQSQSLVAEETLACRPLRGVRTLLDVGGGQGRFLRSVAKCHPKLTLQLFDLPQVVANLPDDTGRIEVFPGSFRDDPLPVGADAISLVRVLYDHDDDTVAQLLQRVFNALPSGGKIIVSEPMLTGQRATDVYFAVYTLAMGTGRTRSADQIGTMLREVGFVRVNCLNTHRKYITEVVVASKP
ncbi:methyltransferase [Phaeobacter sp.]|uniref:methyltransferase n=1 Tax=Phaeobacter sp. TaxID=1902409 RepID=UPI0025F3B464|nr:methyltransferase [Phaeobacter sp.]